MLLNSMWPVRPSNSTCPRENELQRPSRRLTPPPAAEPGVAGTCPTHRPSTLLAGTAMQSSCLNPNCFQSLARVAERRGGEWENQQCKVQGSLNFFAPAALEQPPPQPLATSLHPKANTTLVCGRHKLFAVSHRITSWGFLHKPLHAVSQHRAGV